MAAPAPARHVRITDHDTLLAAAELRPPLDGTARAALHVASGHLPPGTRARLVDTVLAQPELTGALRLVASAPMGDSEVLDRVRERCLHVRTRAAGATTIVEADLRP
jgi:hypothetical protein